MSAPLVRHSLKNSLFSRDIIMCAKVLMPHYKAKFGICENVSEMNLNNYEPEGRGFESILACQQKTA